MIYLTPNVRLPEAAALPVLLSIASSAFSSLGFDIHVTSAFDGKHGANSLHGKGLALDFRIKHLDGKMGDISGADRKYAERIVALLRQCCDHQFDIVLESDHIHAEYDPK